MAHDNYRTSIVHSRGDVTLMRKGAGPNTQWTFTVEGQTSTPRQEFIINSAQVLADLKAIIGQVEHAAKVLARGEGAG